MPKCPHGNEFGAQNCAAQDDQDSMYLLAFFSACDCCDALMHHSTCGHGYFVMLDGRTLCGHCSSTEPAENFDDGGEREVPA